MEKIKIIIKDKAHSELVQHMLFAVGCRWRNHSPETVVRNREKPQLYVDRNKNLSYSDDLNFFNNHSVSYKEVDFSWLCPPVRVITLDGKDIEISEESYQAFKKQFK
jgi:hypothetical protein